MARVVRLLAPTIAAVVATVAIAEAFNLVVAHTRLGHTYKVNQAHAHQFIGFVNELERTYGPIHHIGCYSRFGHVYMSQHHVGNACDIEQYGWGRTSYRAMYRLGWLPHKYGLRNGCSFGDCGHVDAGGPSWVNGAPPGRLASAEIPSTRTDVAEVGRDHEWPKTLPVAQKSTKPAGMQLAGEERPLPKRLEKPALHRDPKWHDDRGGVLRITYNKRQQWLDAQEDKIRLLPGLRGRIGKVLVNANEG